MVALGIASLAIDHVGCGIASFRIAKLSWQLVGVGEEMVMDLEWCEEVSKVSKDDVPDNIRTFLKQKQVQLHATVRILKTNNGTEFLNQQLKEAARMLLIFSNAHLYLWVDVVAIVFFTQKHSIIHTRYNKTPYELINGRKLDISFLHVFGVLCYPYNDREDLGILKDKGDIGFFIRYSETGHASATLSQEPGLQQKTSGHICSRLVLNKDPLTINHDKPSKCNLDHLYEMMYDDYKGNQPDAQQTTHVTPFTAGPLPYLITPPASKMVKLQATTPKNSSTDPSNIDSTSENVDKQDQQQDVNNNVMT
ncbi:retrovirus-related pol polyprotein from transposon TNT 1-94 [Tanacetum coccineum]